MGGERAGKVVLITGGTGSLGTALTKRLLADGFKVRAYARGEHKHEALKLATNDDPNLSSLIGDIRDIDRLKLAMKGVDVVIHAAALKGVPACEYDPCECMKTNIQGSANVAEAALAAHVHKAVLISTDKASSPCTMYGASKLAAERLWVASNRYCGNDQQIFTAVRYGNVWGSAGSVVWAFMEQARKGLIKVTDTRMTRFHLRLPHAVELVLQAVKDGVPGGCIIPKIPSYNLMDLVDAIDPTCKTEIIGIRGQEKIYESLIGEHESPYALEYQDCFVLGSAPVGKRFEYTSSSDKWRLSVDQLKEEIAWLLKERSS